MLAGGVRSVLGAEDEGAVMHSGGGGQTLYKYTHHLIGDKCSAE